MSVIEQECPICKDQGTLTNFRIEIGDYRRYKMGCPECADKAKHFLDLFFRPGLPKKTQADGKTRSRPSDGSDSPK